MKAKKILIKYYEEQSKDQLRAMLELAGRWEAVDDTRLVFSNGVVYRWYYL